MAASGDRVEDPRVAGVLCECVRRRLGGSEFLLWVCVMCVGCGIWAGERDLLVWGVGRPGRMMTHLSECGRVYLVGGLTFWSKASRGSFVYLQKSRRSQGLNGMTMMAPRACICLYRGVLSLAWEKCR